jgi:hypothetical protein
MSVPAFQQVAATLALTGNGTTSVNSAIGQRVNGCTLRVVNLNTVPCFVVAGIGAQTATATGTPVGASATSDIYVGAADNVAIVLSAAGTAVVYICPGG